MNSLILQINTHYESSRSFGENPFLSQKKWVQLLQFEFPYLVQGAFLELRNQCWVLCFTHMGFWWRNGVDLLEHWNLLWPEGWYFWSTVLIRLAFCKRPLHYWTPSTEPLLKYQGRENTDFLLPVLKVEEAGPQCHPTFLLDTGIRVRKRVSMSSLVVAAVRRAGLSITPACRCWPARQLQASRLASSPLPAPPFQ